MTPDPVPPFGEPGGAECALGVRKAALLRARAGLVALRVALVAALGVCVAGCQVLTYSSPGGERFSRAVFGTTTALSSLSVAVDTNGVRRIDLRGYQNDASQAAASLTEAAVRAAIQSAR